jgi:hypothetical protein
MDLLTIGRFYVDVSEIVVGTHGLISPLTHEVDGIGMHTESASSLFATVRLFA